MTKEVSVFYFHKKGAGEVHLFPKKPMRLENWTNAEKEMPAASGEYLVKRKEKTGDEKEMHALYLKAGEFFLTRIAPNSDDPENSILFALNRPILQIKIPTEGFYLCRKTKNGEEILSYLPNKNLFWTYAYEKKLQYEKRRKELKKIQEAESDEEQTKKELSALFTREPITKMLYDRLLTSFQGTIFDFCGTSYYTNPLAIDNSFLTAIRYRRIIRSLQNYTTIDRLIQMAFSEDAKEIFPLSEALALREDLCAYLRSKGEKESDIETISDAYFINLFLPTRLDVIRVLFQKEIHSSCLSRELSIVRVFQRYQIIDALRQLGMLYAPDRIKDPIHDNLIDTIAVIQLAQALAINRFKIREFKDNFGREMGISV